MPHNNCCSSSSATASTPAPQRPRGLWRARSTAAPRSANHAPEKIPPSQKRLHAEHIEACSHHHEHLADFLDPLDDRLSAYDSDSSLGSHKRRRLASDTPPTSDDEVQYWDYSRKCSPHPERLSKWVTRSKIMDTTSTVGPGAEPASQDRSTCDMEDWEDLKELFAKAAEIYENQPPNEAILLLRGVIHECHRFMRLYYDPSIIYAPPAPVDQQKAPMQTPPEQRMIRDWLADRPPLYPPQSEEKKRLAKARATNAEEAPKKCKCKDLVSAFYTILGTTLFFFGNLIDQDSTLAAEGEPNIPTPYWLSAIDVFEIGENLPIRTSGRGCPNAPEDWRMAIVWGRTLVCLAHEALARQKGSENEPEPEEMDAMAKITSQYTFAMPASGPFGPPIGGVPLSKVGTPDEPYWPPGSPFALIVERRLPRTSRMTLSNTTPDELMLIAKDQFSRGIFHMPHPLHHSQRARKFSPPAKELPAVFTCTPPLTAYYSATAAGAKVKAAASASVVAETEPEPEAPAPESSAAPSLIPNETFSRAKELFTIASEVLDVAERFPSPTSRASLAGFADGVLSQMKMEANTEHAAAYGSWARAGTIVLARGRANLVIGAAKAEEIEDRLEADDVDEAVWECDQALDGREALGVAVVYLEKAREALVAKKEEEAREREKTGYVVPTAGAAGPLSPEDDEVVMVESASDSEDEEDGGEMDTTAAASTPVRGAPAPEASEEDTIAEIGTMLAEALITLANLTKDPKEREALYAQAQKESGDTIMLDSDDDDDEDRMDV